MTTPHFSKWPVFIVKTDACDERRQISVIKNYTEHRVVIQKLCYLVGNAKSSQALKGNRMVTQTEE